MSWQSLEIVRLTVKYGTELALHQLSASLQRGQVYLVVGPNGSGKTTLLRAIAGLVATAEGEVEPKLKLDDWQNDLGVAAVLPEDLGNYGQLTTRDVVRRVCLRRAVSRRQASALVRQTTADLEGLIGAATLGRPQNELSGGQRRLVAITLALVLAPTVLVADEHFAGLDAKLSAWVEHQFSGHASAGGLVVVTHNGDHGSFSSDWRRLELRASVPLDRHTLIELSP